MFTKSTTTRRLSASAILALTLLGATACDPAQPAGPTQSTTSTATPTSPSSSTPTSIATATATSAATSPASAPATTADPLQAVDSAWLTPAQMPFADTFQWKAEQADPKGSSPIGKPLTPTVFYVANKTAFQTLTDCADPTTLLGRTTGAQHTEFDAGSGGSGHASSQFIFFFADAASAQQTFTWIQSQYGPSCMPGSGVTITKTAGDGVTSAAWLTLRGPSGPVDLSPYNREYFVLRGDTIAYVSIESATTLPTTYNDAAQLSTIAAHLCVYGGPCS